MNIGGLLYGTAMLLLVFPFVCWIWVHVTVEKKPLHLRRCSILTMRVPLVLNPTKRRRNG